MTGPLLLVSLSGLTDGDDTDLARAVAFAGELDRLDVPLTHLIQPRGPEGPLVRDDAFVRWAAGRVCAGDDVLLHGYDHTADPVGSWQNGAVPRIGRRTEFGALPRHEATLRLTAARRILTTIGLTTDGFAPPRWVASEGTLEALAGHGFRLCADETALRSPEPGGPDLRARVLTFRGEQWPRSAERPAGENRRVRAFEQAAIRAAARGSIVRIAVRAKDLRKQNRVDATLHTVAGVVGSGATATIHRGLLPTPARAA